MLSASLIDEPVGRIIVFFIICAVTGLATLRYWESANQRNVHLPYLTSVNGFPIA